MKAMITTLVLGLAVLGMTFSLFLGKRSAEGAPSGGSIYDFKMRDIDGKEVPLGKFKGKLLLVVNVASKCGLTPQYEGLEKLYETYKDRGLVVMGFPANQFGGQEPGTDSEIKTFCTANYHVTFPMFSKIVVKGEGIHPLYAWLLQQTENKGDIEWNFAKFLVGVDGRVLKRFHPKVKPDDKEIVGAIESALKD